jgi:hypothetical protein
VKSFLGVVVDCRAKVFKITPRTTGISPMFGERSAICAGHIGQHLAAQPFH